MPNPSALNPRPQTSNPPQDDEEEDEPATPPARTRPAIAHSESLLSELSEAGTAPSTAGTAGGGVKGSPELKMPLFIHGGKAGEVVPRP